MTWTMTCTPSTLPMSREKCYRSHSLAFHFQICWGDHRSSEDFYTTVMDITRKLTVIFSQWRQLLFMHLGRGKKRKAGRIFSAVPEITYRITLHKGLELPFLRTYLLPVLAELDFHQATLFTVFLKEEASSTPVFVFLSQDSNQQPGSGGIQPVERAGEQKAPGTP